jgi:PAS domain S-box-containing protein
VGRTGEEIGLWAAEHDSVELLERLVEKGSVHDLNVGWRHHSGEIHRMVLSASALTLDGELLFVSLTRRLTPGRRQHTAIFDRARDAVTILDLQGRITYWNPAAERLYGWLKAEAVGHFASELLAEEPEGQGFAGAFDKAPFVRELTHHTRRGESVEVLSWSTLLGGGSGRPRSRLVVCTTRW